MGKLLFVWGTLICLNIGVLLQTIGYDFIDNKPIFILGTAFIGLGAIFTIVNLVKSYEKNSGARIDVENGDFSIFHAVAVNLIKGHRKLCYGSKCDSL